jgi:hypothetical protein
MSDKIISLARKTQDSMRQSPDQALQSALKETEKGGALHGRKKILILSLGEDDGQYSVSFFQSGMRSSECVSLCEVSKAIFLAEMNYV